MSVGAGPRVRTKYGAKKTMVDGITFDSKHEAARYRELCLRLKDQDEPIRDLVCHPRFALYVPLPYYDKITERLHRQQFSQDVAPATWRLCDGEYGPGCKAKRIGYYTADFAYVRADGTPVVEDVKGGKATKTEAYRLRKKMVEATYGVRIEEIA